MVDKIRGQIWCAHVSRGKIPAGSVTWFQGSKKNLCNFGSTAYESVFCYDECLMLCDLSEDCWSRPRSKLVLQIRTRGFDFQWGYYYFLLRQTKINSVYISSDDYFDGCFLFVSEESSSDVNVSSPTGNIETNRICFAPCLQFKASNARMTTNAKYGQKQLCRKRTWFLYSFLLSYK